MRGLIAVMSVCIASNVYAQDFSVESGAVTLIGLAAPVEGNSSAAAAAPAAEPPAPAGQSVTPTPAPAAPPAAVPSSVPPATPSGTVPAASASAIPPKPASVAPPPVAAATVPADYVIGPDDILSIAFWRDKEMSADVVVRPDGKITLPLVNDIAAAGLTPDQLRDRVQAAAANYVEQPTVNITVKQVNSRKVYVTGNIARPGAYPLSAPTTVLQFLSLAGGVSEYADKKKIVVMRIENGKQQALRFNYHDVSRGKNLQQNILLKPGDTVIVP